MEKYIHVLMLILVLLVLESASLASNFSSLSHADECSLLLKFKESMSINKSASDDSRAYPKVASWNLNGSDGAGNCCLWDGVECRLGLVIGLDLSSSFLSGPISSNNSLFNLIHLRTLNLANNDFRSSQIPSGIGRLSQLTNLNLSYSFFSGEVPKQISHLRDLVSLDLSRNYDGLKLHSSDFQNLVQNTSETLRELFLSWVNIDFVPDSLVNSSSLTSLVMSYCGLSGNFPTGILYLQKLQVLDLQFNENLAGYIPEFHGNSELKQLIVAQTKFQGSIPASIGNLTHLNVLDLSVCGFMGTLPASVSNLTQLTYLSLSGNNFDRWKLPDWFGKLNKITHLYLSHVNLYGEIPSSFFNLTQVEELYLSRNQLKGELPISLFLSLKKLENLNLNRNNISLSVIDSHTNETQPKFKVLKLASCNLKVFPEFLRFQHQLEYLNLDNNNIEGLIPGWMWNISKNTLSVLSLTHNLLIGFEQDSPVASWVNLRLLDLSHNMLHGSIPVPPPTTGQFSISNNRLTGEIPPSICDLLSLQWLDLSFNNITGLIPPCLKKLSNSLVVLNLRRNTFQGTIPNIFTNKSQYQMIDLSENKLQGQIPRSLENCESLQILDLGYNLIEDMFPFWLGSLSELQILILRFNKLHGTITIPRKIKVNFPKLHIIDLSYNSFCGDLPHQYFQEWSGMKKTEVNQLLGGNSFSIQMTNKGVKMEYVKIIKFFSAVDFSSNMFRGKIPESIKTLGALQLLNLSNNAIDGVIPQYMGNLTNLESLDLSSNKLSGKIPQELVQLNFLAFLKVSNNNLTGPIPQGKQFSTFSNDSYMGNALCGFPLSKKCGDSEASKPPKVSFKEDTESDFPNGIDWVVILIGVVTGLVIGLIYGDYLSTKYYKWVSQRSRR